MMEFHRPETLEDALELVHGEPEAQFLAGGATLVQKLNDHSLRPRALISLAGLAELRESRELHGGSVWLGAMTSHAEVAASALLEGGQRLLCDAAAAIGNPAVRNMGTLGGSAATGAPNFDYPAALVCLGATFEVLGRDGVRSIAAEEFFVAAHETALHRGELILGVLVPGDVRAATPWYERLARTGGDSPIAAVAVLLRRAKGLCEEVRIAVGGGHPIPVRASTAERAVRGSRPDAARAARAAEADIGLCDPPDDIRASARYRRRVLPGLIGKAVEGAWSAAS